MQWDEDDLPSEDINIAQMRAKYYGAHCITHRPLLYHAMLIAGQSTKFESSRAPGMTASTSQQVSPSITHSQHSSIARSSTTNLVGGWTSSYTYRELSPKLQQACKVCIDSAIRSTEAFDGIEGRPVVANIFGTAHAYVSSTILARLTG